MGGLKTAPGFHGQSTSSKYPEMLLKSAKLKCATCSTKAYEQLNCILRAYPHLPFCGLLAPFTISRTIWGMYQQCNSKTSCQPADITKLHPKHYRWGGGVACTKSLYSPSFHVISMFFSIGFSVIGEVG